MKILFLLLLCGMLAGCSSPNPTHRSAALSVKSELMLMIPDEATAQQVSSASSVPPSTPNAGAVLIAPDVIAYPVAGREDPQHKDVMYGGTWVYRRTSPKWRLQPAPAQDLIVGPATRDERNEIQPVQNQELTTFLLEQRTLNDQNRQAITRLIHLQQELQNQIGELRRSGSPSKQDNHDESTPEHLESSHPTSTYNELHPDR